MRNNCGLKNYPRKKISNPQNVQKEKLWTSDISTRKNLGLPIYPREKIWTHDIPTRKTFGPIKVRDTRDQRWHETHEI